MFKRTVLLVLFFFVLSSSVASAQTPPTTTDTTPPSTTGASDGNSNGFKITETEVAAYNAAVKNCDTPSLECLVRYVTRFVAIEWVNDINGRPTQLVNYGADTLPPANQTAPPGTDTGTTNAISSLPGGAISGAFNLMGAMYSKPPAHTATYVADVIRTTGFATPAYAQGLGFASLDPILNLWKTFRNVAYFFFIIIFMVIGFMIMLRQKISGQTAVTAQQAIPSVIISLILVTFSYAISGFLIDMMYLLMFLIVGLFEGISTTINSGATTAKTIAGGELINFNILSLIGFFFTDSIGKLDANITLVTSIFQNAGGTNVATGLAGILGGLTLTVVITVAVLIGTIKLFFELLKSYAAIILYVVAAPLILMFGAIPGKNVFGGWVKGIIGNLIAFPTVLLMVVLYVEFTKGASNGAATGGFLPPFLFGNGTVTNMLGPMLGLAIILSLADIVKEVKKTAGAGDGGIGTMLAGWAGNSLRAGWNGDKNYGFIPSGKRIAGITAGLPLSGVGAYAGYRMGSSKAKELGLEGSAATAVRTGGALAGASILPSLPRHLRNLGGQVFKQARDTEVQRQLEDLELAIAERKKQAEAIQQQELINSQTTAQPASTASTTTRGVSSSLINKLQKKP